MSEQAHYDFTGLVAVVTGAASGIGRATALGLATGGAMVAILDIAAADETANAITEADGTALPVTTDVRDAHAWRRAIDAIKARFGTIDILVNNAGIAVPGDTGTDVAENVFDRIMAINAKGVWLGMRAVLPIMVAKKKGKICNVASTAAHIGLRDASAYCASKGAVLALTRQAGVQYAADNIQINSVSPGPP
jgi:NAD(P)-dependent dehydrogenase (short-subunit alcohol dehydrogenase family)